MSQPIVTGVPENYEIPEAPSTGGGAALTSVAGVQAVNFAALVNRAYTFDPSATLTATLPTVLTDGDVVQFSSAVLPAGGELTLDPGANTIAGFVGPVAISFNANYSGCQFNTVTVRWNAAEATWQLISGNLGLSLQLASHIAAVAVQQSQGDFELLDVPAGHTLYRPVGDTVLRTVPFQLPWDNAGVPFNANFNAAPNSTARVDNLALPVCSLPAPSAGTVDDGCEVRVKEVSGGGGHIVIDGNGFLVEEPATGVLAASVNLNGNYAHGHWKLDLAATTWRYLG